MTTQKQPYRCIADPPERWRAVVGYEGSYEVSDRGRVRSLDRVVMRSNGASLHIQGRLRRLTVGARGYPTISCCRKGRKMRLRQVHEMVLAAFVGPCPAGSETRHLDGNKLNNRLSNLQYGTRQENEADRILHGTSNRGERCGNARLTRTMVKEILRLRAAGWLQRKIASRFKVSQNHVKNILLGRRWGWFTCIAPEAPADNVTLLSSDGG
jgi:hypothetical protein